MLTKRIDFFLKFITQPQKIGSITPSSSFLAKNMLADLPWSEIKTVVELGAGTGVFTKFISKNITNQCEVVVIEKDSTMRNRLKNIYPDFHYGSKAEQLEHLLKTHDLPQADCIISGLPFAIFPKELCKTIIKNVTHSLKDGGIFVAFQYSPHMYKMLNKHFDKVNLKFVLFNVPPAFIYLCKKNKN